MTPTTVVEVGGPSPYRIDIQPGLLDDAACIAARWRGRHALIVSDDHVAPRYAEALRQSLHLAKPDAVMRRPSASPMRLSRKPVARGTS